MNGNEPSEGTSTCDPISTVHINGNANATHPITTDSVKNQCSLDNLLNELDDVLLSTSAAELDGKKAQADDAAYSDSDGDKLSKFYAKFSSKCSEIERLEKQVHQLQERLVSTNHDKEASLNQIRDLNRNHCQKVAELEKRLLDMDAQIKSNKDKAAAQEETLRKNTIEKETRLHGQLDQAKKLLELTNKDRDNAVIKYAQREKEILSLESNEKKFQQQIAQLSTERDALNSRLRGAKNEKEQLLQVLGQKENDISDWKRKHDEVKALIQENEIKAKVADKRVDIVEQAHSETKLELEKMMKKWKESKEENATIKADYERVVHQFQDTEEKKRVEIVAQQQENVDQKEVLIHGMMAEELENLKAQYKMQLNDCEKHGNQILKLESDKEEQKRRINELGAQIDHKESIIEKMQRQIDHFENEMTDFERLKKSYADFKSKIESLKEENSDLERESTSFRTNAENMLALTQKLTDSNSHLQSENVGLLTKLTSIERENKKLGSMCEDLKHQLDSLNLDYDSYRNSTENEMKLLTERLEIECEKGEQFNVSLEDERNQNKILKKKHQAAVKDLKNELSLSKRRLEAYEAGTASVGSSFGADDPSTAAVNSRSPSMTSLDVPSGSTAKNRSGVETPSENNNNNESPSGRSRRNSICCDHNQAMIEKIVKLQRMLARRSEKIEFLEEHVKQMTTEIQKKSRIIQLYVLREETGNLTSEDADISKSLPEDIQAQLAKKSNTVMGRIFRHTAANNFNNGLNVAENYPRINDINDLSPELAVQIINKLQASFEDTLLKNITLKENIQTLGEEISNLSRENRTLRLDTAKR